MLGSRNEYDGSTFESTVMWFGPHQGGGGLSLDADFDQVCPRLIDN